MKPGGFKSDKVKKKKKMVCREISLIGSNLPGVNDLHSITLPCTFGQGSFIGFGTRVQDTDNADINIHKVSRKKGNGILKKGEKY